MHGGAGHVSPSEQPCDSLQQLPVAPVLGDRQPIAVPVALCWNPLGEVLGIQKLVGHTGRVESARSGNDSGT